MKSLNEYLNEYVQQHIYEVSDELLQRAIDKCYAQNTALTRRRAKEFEKYLKDPKRIKRQELSAKSQITQKFIKAYDEYVVKAYELYDSGKKKECLPLLNDFGEELGKIINDFGTANIDVETTGKFHTFDKRTSKPNTFYLDPDPGLILSKRRDGSLFEHYGAALRIFFTLSDDNQKLMAHDYRKRVEARFIIQFYKKENRKDGNHGEYSTWFDMPWNCIPPEYKDEFKSIFAAFKELQGEEMNNNYERYIGQDSLERHLPGWELLNNTFYAHMEDHTLKNSIERMADVLKENDPNCKIEFKDKTETSHPTNTYYGSSNIRGIKTNITATLTYNGVDYEVSGESDSSGWSRYAKIRVNGEPIFGASVDRYDDACWVGGRYKPYYDNLKKFFND